jgi:hypothetical protein
MLIGVIRLLQRKCCNIRMGPDGEMWKPIKAVDQTERPMLPAQAGHNFYDLKTLVQKLKESEAKPKCKKAWNLRLSTDVAAKSSAGRCLEEGATAVAGRGVTSISSHTEKPIVRAFACPNRYREPSCPSFSFHASNKALELVTSG